MSFARRRSGENSFINISQEDLVRFLQDIDCVDLVRKLKEDGLSTCINIPAGETITTACEKIRQLTFSPAVEQQIKKYLNKSVEALILTNRMSLATCWLGILIDEARTTDNLSRKEVLDDFLKQFFDHADKLKDEMKDEANIATVAAELKMAAEDIPIATTALSFFKQLQKLYQDSSLQNASVPDDLPIDDKAWSLMLVQCGRQADVDLYPYAEILELATAQVKDLILQRQAMLMKDCVIRIGNKKPSTSGHQNLEELPVTYYNLAHLKPLNLRPVELPEPSVNPGDQVFKYDKMNYPWKLWNVISVSRNVLKLVDPANTSRESRQATTEEVATFRNVAEEGIWLPVGTIVVAWLDERGSNLTPFGYTDHYYQGMVIEGPCGWNRFRYLIYFENGTTTYVRPDFVCRRIHQWEDNYSKLQQLQDSMNFLKEYLEKWPQRPYIMADVGQTLICDYYGKSYSVIVEEIDCSLIRVQRCVEKSGDSEWIHRGSSRFELVEHFRCTDRQLNGGRMATPLRPHRIKTSSSHVEVATWKENGPVNDDGDLLSNSETFCSPKSASKKHKPVAKKSSVAGLTIRPSNLKRTKSPPPQRSAEELQGSTKDREMKPPQPFITHTCNHGCVGGEAHLLANQRDQNPFYLPILTSWSRAQSNQIAYFTPCGRRLNNMKEVEMFLRVVQSKLSIDMFSFERELKVDRYFSSNEPFFKWNNDISGGRLVEPHQPVRFINTIDDAGLDPFLYTNECILSDKIISKGNEPEYLVGCDCVDGCSEKCFCRHLTNVSAGNPGGNLGYEHRRLNGKVATGIYECNSRCKCACVPDSCSNRVVQRGMRVRLQVFKTKEKGWGVQALDDIPKGQFLTTYSGEIFTSEEADKIGYEQGDQFLYDLDFLDVAIRHKQTHDTFETDSNDSSDDQMEIDRTIQNQSLTHRSAYSAPLVRLYHGVLDNYAFVMDAKRKGNISRFFNHSCDPNLIVQNVFVNSHDMRLPTIAFFTSRRIRAGEELTWDYSYQPGTVPGRIILCKCGSPICRGRLL